MAEQGTHKPLVGGSNPPLAISLQQKAYRKSNFPQNREVVLH
jgi:hypothetical protein